MLFTHHKFQFLSLLVQLLLFVSHCSLQLVFTIPINYILKSSDFTIHSFIFSFALGCYSSHIKILYEIQNQFKNKEDYSVIVLEDNLEITKRMSEKVLSEVAEFVDTEKNWDVFHLAYMM